MALVSVNGHDAIETRLCMPRAGAWHLDVLVDDPDALTGQVTVNVNSGTLVLVGTVVRSGVFADTGHVRIFAGAAGLGVSASPRHYSGPSVRGMLADLLGTAGETLSAMADASILATGLDAWTTTATPVNTLITLLLAAAAPGASWRMLPDGTLWVGRETWPDAGVDSSLYQIFEDSAEARTMLIGVDAPLALVGTTFEGRRVSYTEASVGQDGHGVEMRLWFEDENPTDLDALKKSFARQVQRAFARTDRIDYGRTYPATIVSQSGSTVDVQPDQVGGKDLLPDMAGVPLLLGLPGASVDGTQGGRVRIGWFGGDPARPYAADFDAANVVRTLVLAASNDFGAQLYLGAQDGSFPAISGARQVPEATMIGILITQFGALAAAAATPPLTPLAVALGAITDAFTAYQTA